MTRCARCSLRWLVLPYQVVVHGEKRQLQPIRDTKLVKNAREVVFDSLNAEREALRDVLVRITVDYRCNHLHLARGEAKVGLSVLTIPVHGQEVAKRLDQAENDLAPHPVLATHHRANAPEQQFRRRLFQHHAPRPKLDGLGHLGLLDRRRQHHGAGARHRPDLAQGLEPRLAGHIQIQQEQVGLQPAHALDGLDAVASLSDDAEVGLGLEQPPQTVAKDGMVVSKQDANRVWGRDLIRSFFRNLVSGFIHISRFIHSFIHVLYAFCGRAISSRAPWPGTDSIASSPPMDRTRSLSTRGPRRLRSSSACERRPENSKPRPSSSITSFQRPSSAAKRTRTLRAWLCLRTFTSASWMMRATSRARCCGRVISWNSETNVAEIPVSRRNLSTI